jgi:hypothetical protein
MKLSYPLSKKGTITSGYGPRNGGEHRGIDIGVPTGTEVKSIANGEVVRSDMVDYRGYGNFIIIKHNIDGQTLYSCYAHLSKRDVSDGDKVIEGQKIGLSGGDQGMQSGSGNSSGAHLHFEIRKSETGDWIDPTNYLTASVFDLSSDNSSDSGDDNGFDLSDLTNLSLFDIDFGKIGTELAGKFKDSWNKTKADIEKRKKPVYEDIERINDIMKKVL